MARRPLLQRLISTAARTLAHRETSAPFRRRAVFESLEPRLLLSATPTLLGTMLDDNGVSGNPAIYGTMGNDTIDGLAGDDYLFGEFSGDGLGGGDDVIVGGEGRDTLIGFDGDDWLEPGPMMRDPPDMPGQAVSGGFGADILFLRGSPADYAFYPFFSGFLVDALTPGAPEGQVEAFMVEQVAFGVPVLDYMDGTARPLAIVDVAQLVPGLAPDRAPIALADAITGARGSTEILIPLPQLLGNDIDLDGDAFVLAELLGAPGVTVDRFDNDPASPLPDVPPELAADFPDGLVRVLLDAPLTAPVTFDYRLADAATGSLTGNTATVTIRPSALPAAADDTLRATIGRDTFFSYDRLLANDSSGLTFLRIVPESVAALGGVRVDDEGSGLRVTSFDTSPSTLSFTYEAQDAFGNVASAAVIVEVFNRAPIVADGAAVVIPGGTYTLRFADLAAFPGTFDPDGDPLTVAFYGTAVPPTATLQGFEDRIEFTFTAGYAGDYALDFALADATGAQDNGRFRFLSTTPAAPAAVADTLRWGISASPGQAFGTFSLSRLLANDTLPPGVKVFADAASFVQPAHGILYVEPGNPTSVVPTTDPLNLMLSYVPEVGFTGIDTVTYAIVDELGRRSITTFTFDVSVPQPVVPEIAIAVPPGATSVSFPASALLANGAFTGVARVSGYASLVDADSGVLQATLDPVTGGYTNFTYTPDATTVLGQDAFFIGVVDQAAEGRSARASTFVRFVGAPQPTVALVSADAGSALEGGAVNPLNNGALTFVIRRSGDLTLGSTVNFTLDAPPGSTLTADDIGMVAEGGNNLRSGLGSFSAVFAPGQETETVYVFATGDVVAEADEAVRLTLTGGTGAALATTGPLSATGRFTNDDPGADLSLSLVVNAEEVVAGGTADVVVRVDNAGPTSGGGTVRLIPGLGVSFLGTSEGFDPATGLWTFGPIAAGGFAELAIETLFATRGTPDITGEIIAASVPDRDSTPGNGLANGEDDIAASSIPVTNAPPIARPDHYTVQQGRTLRFPTPGLMANDSDPDGDVISMDGASGAANGQVVMITDGRFIYTPRAGVFFGGQFFPGFVGTDSFFYIITDGASTARATVTIDVMNTAPSANPDAYSVKAGHALTVAAGGVLANDVDPDGDVLQVVSVVQPTHGAVTLARDGGLVYTPNEGFVGTDTFDYTFTDGAATATSRVTIGVEPVAVVTGWSATDVGTTPEGNGPGPAGTLTFVITRTGDLSVASTANFSVEGGAGGTTSDDVALVTAGGTDLGSGFGTYTASFAAGQASATITIRAAGDRVPEADEGVVLTLLSTSDGTLVQPDARVAAGRFLNDDVPTADLSLSLDIAADELQAGDSGDVVVRVDNAGPDSAGGTVRLTPGLGVRFLGTSEGFDPATGIWTFGPIASGGFAELAIETVFATAGTPDVTAEVTTASLPDPDSTPGNGTINGEDDVAAAGIRVTVLPPTISWSDAYNSNLESMPDGTGGVFLVGFVRGGDLTGASTLYWTVAAADPPSGQALGARAAQSADIVGGFRSGTLDFAPGQDTAEIRLQYVNDTLSEPAEFLALTLTGASNGRIAGQSEWIEKIRDDEPTLYSIAGTTDATEGTAPGAGGELAFVIRREGVLATGDVIFTVSGSGAAGSGDAADLVDGFGTRTVSFAEGETEKTVTLAVSPDGMAEGDEAVLVNLTGLQHATDSAIGSPASALLTIFNDDAPIADLSLDSRILVGGEIVGVDEFGSPAGTTYTLRLTAANTAGAAIPADARVRITFPDAAIDIRGLLPEDADVTVDDVSATGMLTLWWQVGAIGPGASADLDLQLTSLLPDEVSLVAEIVESTAPDADSTPGNGVGAHEDDALAVVLYATPGDPPVARPDSYTVVEGGTLTIPAAQGLLANDTYMRGDTFQVSGNYPGVILTVAADGAFTFVAPRGILADTDYAYTVTLTDAFGQVSAPAAFTVHVQDRPNPVGVADVYSVYEGETLSVDAAHGLLANDPPPPGGGAAVNNSLTDIGALAIDSSGAFMFVAPARVNADTDTTFTYRVQDELGQLSDAVPVTIRVLNRVHQAVFASGIERTLGSIDAVTGVQTVRFFVQNAGFETVDTVVLNFDYDNFTMTGSHGTGEIHASPGGGTFVATGLAPGAVAEVVLTGTSPQGGQARFGIDVVSATIDGDVFSSSDLGTVAVSIFWQVIPLTADLSLSTELLVDGTPVGIDEIGFPAGSDFTLRLVAQNAPTLSRSADPTVRITFPSGALDLNGILPETADLTYEPVGSDGMQVLTWRPGALEVGASAVLDLVVSPLVPLENLFRAEIVSSSFADPDSTPGNGASHVFGTEDDEVSVVFYGTAGVPPVVRADSFTVAEGGTLTVLPSQGLLVNDDVLRGSTINVSGSHAGVTFNVAADGGFTFVAPSGITATSVYVYSYTVTDVFGQTSAPATISVQVDDRPSPIGQSDTYVVIEGETLNVSALLGVLSNDAPAPGTLVASHSAPAVGTVTVNADGAFTFVAPAAVTEDTYATFDYVLVDAQGQRSLPIPVTVLVANRQLFADVSIEVLPAQPVYDFGTTQQTITVRVRNDGPSAVDETRVAFGYQDFTVVSATTASGTSAFDAGTGSWTVGPLAAGATADLVITSGTAQGGVTPRLTAEITQVRRSGEIVLDPDSTSGNGTGRGEDDEATGTWTVRPPQADIRVSVFGPSRALAGQSARGFVSIVNNSSRIVDNVIVFVRIRLPEASLGPSVGSYDAATGLWTVGTLAPGSNATLSFSGRTMPPDAEVFARIVSSTVSGVANQDPDSTNDRQSLRWSADYPRADLGVSVSGGRSLVAGQTANGQVRIGNSSTLSVDNVIVFVNPLGLSEASLIPSVGSYDAATRLWTVGTLRSGGSATLTVSGRTVPRDAEVFARIVSSTVFGFANTDPNSSNDRANLRWRVDYPQADLGVDVRGGGSGRIAGEIAGVTVEIRNAGTAGLAVDNVAVQVYRSGYGLSAFTPSAGSFDAATGLWTVGTLRSGGSATLQFSGQTTPPGGQVVANILSSTVFGFANRDPNSSNNRDSLSWSVNRAREDLGVDVRRLSSTAPLVDESVDVEVVVSSAGRMTLNTDNVVVQLSRTNYLASTFTPSMGTYDAATGLWTVGTLGPGQRQAMLRITGSSVQAGSADVSASLRTATVLGWNNEDPRFSNNADIESWTVPLPPRPSGLPDDYFTDEGVPLVVPAASGLLANDGQSRFTVVDSVTTPTIGTLAYEADGSFTYTPPRHVVGDQRATFVYTLRDASGQLSDPVEVAIRVRDVIAPADLSLALQMVVGGVVQTGTAFGFDSGESFTLRLVARNDGPGDADGVIVRLPLSEEDFDVIGTLPEDADLERDASGYLWRVGTLAEGDEISLDIELGALRRGTFALNAEIVQSRSPDPDSTPGNGADEDDEAGFTVEVENAPPVAVGDRYTAEPGVELVVNGPGVLGNDSDANGDALILDLAALDTTGLQGDLTFISPEGGFQFRPADGFTGTTSFLYGVTDLNGAVTLGTVTLDVIPRPLRVASFAQSDSGFHVGFDQTLDLARLNLYGTTGTPTGATDVTLVGAATGAVRGSLVVDADASGFTFVKTGGVLAPDTYTLTVRSGAEGVRSGFGGLLDGDANGTAGDAHVRTFTVQAGGERVLSLPDFMRGPGQSVVVPNTSNSGALPLRLSDGNGVEQLSAELQFDAQLLQIDEVRLKAGIAGNVTTSAIAGGLHIEVVLDAPLGAGAVDLVEIVSQVPAGAPYGAQQVLDLGNVTLRGTAGNVLPVIADDAVHTMGYFGDTTGDQAYSRADYDGLLRVVVRTDTGFTAWANTDPVIVGDLNGNGQLSTLDANRLLQHTLGTARPEIPALPAVVPPAPALILARLSAPASANPAESTEVTTTAAGQRTMPGVSIAPVVLPEVTGPSATPGSASDWKSASWAKDLTQRLQGLEGKTMATPAKEGGVLRTALRTFLKR